MTVTANTTAPDLACDLCGGRQSRHLVSKNDGAYFECVTCGFIFSGQPDEVSASVNAEYFSGEVAKYVDKCYAAAKQRRYARKLRVFRPYRRLNRLLEVGCNVGGLLHCARTLGWDAVGVEPVAPCARYAAEQRGLEVIPTTLEAAELAAESFDAVFSNAVFEHLTSPTRVMGEIARVLRPGGVVFIDTVNWASYTRENLGAEWHLVDPLCHLCLYTPRTLNRLCEDHGFEVVRMSSHGVRFRSRSQPAARGFAHLGEELRKMPLSALARFNLKGDSIEVLARKPD